MAVRRAVTEPTDPHDTRTSPMLAEEPRPPAVIVDVAADVASRRAAGSPPAVDFQAEATAERNRANNLAVALQSNRRIGMAMAMGILMGRLGVTEEDAFERLRIASQNQHIKLRDVAEVVIY